MPDDEYYDFTYEYRGSNHDHYIERHKEKLTKIDKKIGIKAGDMITIKKYNNQYNNDISSSNNYHLEIFKSINKPKIIISGRIHQLYINEEIILKEAIDLNNEMKEKITKKIIKIESVIQQKIKNKEKMICILKQLKKLEKQQIIQEQLIKSYEKLKNINIIDLIEKNKTRFNKELEELKKYKIRYYLHINIYFKLKSKENSDTKISIEKTLCNTDDIPNTKIYTIKCDKYNQDNEYIRTINLRYVKKYGYDHILNKTFDDEIQAIITAIVCKNEKIMRIKRKKLLYHDDRKIKINIYKHHINLSKRYLNDKKIYGKIVKKIVDDNYEIDKCKRILKKNYE